MEYIYATMLLHSGDKEINEENVKSVIEAAGIEASDVRIKGLIAALEDVDIDEAIETTALAAAPAAGVVAPVTEEKAPDQEEDEEEEEASEEEAAAGLGALFG
ncbi:MAG: 50S ribosomal protein P1 [Methanobrevibacter sp.]|nr:50S ribosomal protein P1 [Candidatus Methanovirga basalitermitum]